MNRKDIIEQKTFDRIILLNLQLTKRGRLFENQCFLFVMDDVWCVKSISESGV